MCSGSKQRTNLHVHADVLSMQTYLSAPLINEGRDKRDAVKTRQLNSPVTMSPAGADSGNGEGPREKAGRSKLPTQARGRTREGRKPRRLGSKEKR